MPKTIVAATGQKAIPNPDWRPFDTSDIMRQLHRLRTLSETTYQTMDDLPRTEDVEAKEALNALGWLVYDIQETVEEMFTICRKSDETPGYIVVTEGASASAEQPAPKEEKAAEPEPEPLTAAEIEELLSQARHVLTGGRPRDARYLAGNITFTFAWTKKGETANA